MGNNFCTDCGKALEGNKFCGNCGRDSSSQTISQAPQTRIDVTQSGVDEKRAQLYESKARNLDKSVKFVIGTINGMAIVYVVLTIASLVGSYFAIRWALETFTSIFGS